MCTPTFEWLTAEEAAGYLKARPRTLLLWVRQGKVKAFALSGTKRRVWRFRKEDLDAALLSTSVLDSEPLTVLSERGMA
jgi:excisionase family DNA binding protein